MSKSSAWLLDTNILSDLVRHPQGVVTEQIKQVGEDSICTSIVVTVKLRYGAIKLESDQLLDHVDLFLSAIETLPFEPPMDHEYAKVHHHLAR
ncbi:PIN domain-containing protein [Thiolapillus sp.]